MKKAILIGLAVIFAIIGVVCLIQGVIAVTFLEWGRVVVYLVGMLLSVEFSVLLGRKAKHAEKTSKS